jgi:membrane-associated protease RseP (regulator of RpoE activity)
MNLHPLAFAGLIGLFVTWLNLIPAGQLDGGHVARGLMNTNRHYQLTKWMGIGLMVLGMFWLPLLMWGILIFIIFRKPHMGALDDLSPLSRRQKLLAAAAFTVFILCLPIPF